MSATEPGSDPPASLSTLEGFPAFARDIDATLSVHSHYILWGNVRELFFVPGAGGTDRVDLTTLLWRLLSRAGFELLVAFDPVDRVRVLPNTDDALTRAQTLIGATPEGAQSGVLEELRQVLRAAADAPGRVAVVVDYASRLVVDAEHLEPEELEFFRFCEKLSQTATAKPCLGHARPRLMNPVFWVLDRDADLPAWFTAGNDAVRIVPVGLPTIGERVRAAEAISLSVPDLAELGDEAREDFAQVFAGSADGLTVRAMNAVVRLAHDRDIGFGDIDDAVRAYRVGMVDNPWRDPDLVDRVRDGEAELRGQVLGQEPAVRAALDVLKRSVLGVTGSAQSSSSAQPRGVLFFAGPTGVGKTELAKSLARLAFGDRNAYLRFDMSEFSAEHTDARLIGAPPGYTGYDAGGELTNGVRQQPFRLLLFDEIEKAHPRILDKFLQILDDGRLTDGRGSTVHFSETFIVFTSNLGIYLPDHTQAGLRWVPNPNVRPGMPYPELRDSLRQAIADFFTSFLNRPELLNRIGLENLVVFDFIRRDVAAAIFDLRMREILETVHAELGLRVEIEPVRDELCQRCTADLSLGGRGIKNALRAQFVNPLSRVLFDRADRPAVVTVRALAAEDDEPAVVLG